ncbi:MAG: hypothetical protein ACRDBL_04615 [Rhabdaerophilum sp.]
MGWKRNVGIGVAGLLGLSVIGAALGGGGKGSPAPAAESQSQAADATPAANDPGISATEFTAIQTGMTQDEVAGIVGSPGEVISENDLAGTRTVMVQWDGESGFGANANAMFQNGKLIQKSQFGLE